MKECIKCHQRKPLEQFNKNGKSKDGKSSYCRLCSNVYARQNYVANRARYFANAKKRDADMRTRLREIKAQPCTDCKVSYPWYVMEFDHLRDKEYDVSHMMRHRMAWDKIQVEIDKCEIVCANCHRVRSYARWSREDF